MGRWTTECDFSQPGRAWTLVGYINQRFTTKGRMGSWTNYPSPGLHYTAGVKSFLYKGNMSVGGTLEKEGKTVDIR